MKDYSQHGEQAVILEYFKDQPHGNLFSIGENDGQTLSNAYALILQGWGGCLFEPVPLAFERLKQLHKDRDNVHLYQLAMATEDGESLFYESGKHLTPNDHGLISTLKQGELSRWKGSKFDNFTQTTVKTVSFDSFYEKSPVKKFDFITIDAEGMDYAILSQIDLNEVGAKMVCIEYNGNLRDARLMDNHFIRYGMRKHWDNGTNLIYVK